ncbi:MAG: signal peptidase II, partial [Ruminococcus sp.]|nr:signal peptidase II [Ruminococcus sp.]
MVLALILAVVFIIIDQVSKYLIASNMKLGESTTIIPGILDFTYTHN